MAVLKNKTQGNYTLVSQNIMRDKNLSLTERGMLLTLLSLPDSWQLTIKGLCQILPDGKDKVSKTLNSLIDKGYITREQSRDGGGKFDSTILEVHETPVKPTEPTQPTDPTDPVDRSRKVIKEFPRKPETSPCPENPDAVNPYAEKPQPENPPQYINNISNNYFTFAFIPTLFHIFIRECVQVFFTAHRHQRSSIAFIVRFIKCMYTLLIIRESL